MKKASGLGKWQKALLGVIRDGEPIPFNEIGPEMQRRCGWSWQKARMSLGSLLASLRVRGLIEETPAGWKLARVSLQWGKKP